MHDFLQNAIPVTKSLLVTFRLTDQRLALSYCSLENHQVPSDGPFGAPSGKGALSGSISGSLSCSTLSGPLSGTTALGTLRGGY